MIYFILGGTAIIGLNRSTFRSLMQTSTFDQWQGMVTPETESAHVGRGCSEYPGRPLDGVISGCSLLTES